LYVWTGNAEITRNTSKLVQIAAVGTICNSLMYIPYQMMLAFGWTRFTIYQNIIAIIILVPLLIWWVHLFGVIGGAMVWLILNVGYILISIPLMHTKILKQEMASWYIKDTLVPFLIFGGAIGLFRYLIADNFTAEFRNSIPFIMVLAAFATFLILATEQNVRTKSFQLFRSLIQAR
jgi:O-antigen/teichoic acid export membrane protein